jgi:hypothetical protein
MLQDRSLDEPAKTQASTAEAAKTANGAGHDAPVTLPAQGPDATRIAIQALAGKALKRAWFATRRTPDGPGMHGGRIGSVARELKNPRSVHAHYINTTTIREDANDRVDANFDTGLFVFADDVGVLVDKTFMDTLGPEPTLVV